ncbi:hypothetical protein ZHAS_00016536 [Anopheles sinensis]|uniref:Uncharacterized protein n=1 Tax=Anopheles sinensis TaxID=74873 RepID=A0A084WDW7_ANOSI|nr:hypothetical protein ZHAS_00016536 [Anopheles sinensis]
MARDTRSDKSEEAKAGGKGLCWQMPSRSNRLPRLPARMMSSKRGVRGQFSPAQS